MASQITALFLDVGGVLGTNGWDRRIRERAADAFGLGLDEMDERHHLTFGTYEEGKLSLDEYLNRVVFYEPRRFSRDAFKAFMFDQSTPYPDMIGLIRGLKARHGLKVAVVSNEGRELMVERISRFDLGSFVDFFIASSFVHFRKPDEDIYRIALDIAQVPAERVAYLEDRPMFVEVSRHLGLVGIHHTGYESTRAKLAQLGLALDPSEGVQREAA
jgi:putative hydrolase of the HAD superfamily